MNRARAFVNDAYSGGAGRILTDSAPFSVEYLNSALEYVQDRLGNTGVITLIVDNFILTPVTPVPNPNPAIQTNISYTGYFDGTANHATPALPGDCIAVLKLWERAANSSENFVEMAQPQGGLCSRIQGTWLNEWEYRQDAIYMIGSTQTEDIRMRYVTRFTPIAKGTDLTTVSIQILASTEALAHVVAHRYARARGAPQTATMKEDAEEAIRQILNRYIQRAQEIDTHRLPYDDGGSSALYGPNLPF